MFRYLLLLLMGSGIGIGLLVACIPEFQLKPTVTSTPGLQPKPIVSSTQPPVLLTNNFGFEFYNEDKDINNPLSRNLLTNVTVKIRLKKLEDTSHYENALQLPANYTYTAEKVIKDGTGVFSELPLGEYEVEASKEGYLTRKKNFTVSLSIGGSSSAHLIFAALTVNEFIGGFFQPAPPLTKRPEVTKVTLLNEKELPNGFKLNFSEPVEHASIEENLIIQIPKDIKYNFSQNRYAYLNEIAGKIVNFGTTYSLVNERLNLLTIQDFQVNWNSVSDELSLTLKQGKTFRRDQTYPVLHSLAFTAKTTKPVLRDLTGDTRTEYFLMPNNSFFEKEFSFFMPSLSPTTPD